MTTKLFLSLLVAMLAPAAGPLLAGDTAQSPAAQIENLTLEQALELAEQLQPQLAEARALVEAAAGRARQVGSFPNPEAILGAQQIPVGGGSNQREYVAGVAQPIPLGGRLSKARQAGQLELETRLRAVEVTRRDVRKRVHSAFALALYQDTAFQTQNQIAVHSEKAVATTKARVEAGDALLADLARVELEHAWVRVELKRSESLQEQSLAGLAAALGNASLKVKSLAGKLDETFEIPTLESLAKNLSSQPEILLADANLRASSARIDLAKAERIPDMRVELLYHRLEATQDNTIDVGVSILLPLFNRNQGRLREARAEVTAAQARARLAENAATHHLQESYRQLITALANSRTIQDEILPRADTVLRSAEARHAAGDVSLAEILPVRRDWAAAKLTYLESLRDVMQAWSELRSFVADR